MNWRALALGLAVLGCSGSTTLDVDIDLAVNQTGNPLTEVQEGIDGGASLGLFFQFNALHCPPVTADDTSGTHEFQSPPKGSAGSDALKDSFNIDSSELLPGTYYRIVMFASDPVGNVTHQGTVDCPVNVSAPAAATRPTICFGKITAGALPVCADTLPFSQCQVSTEFCR